MDRIVSLDTSFLIDLQRERLSGEGAAHRFLRADLSAKLCVSSVVLGELVQGFDDPRHPALEVLRTGLDILPIDEGVALQYGSLARHLRSTGQLIGANDLWIAATSLRHELPLVTANHEHFERAPGLEVLRYRD